MLDIKLIRSNPKKIADNCQKRNVNVDIEKLLILDEKVREITMEIDSIRKRRNDISSKMKKNIPNIERRPLIEESKNLREDEYQKEEVLRKIINDRNNIHKQVPNVTHPDVPEGFSDDDNLPIKQVGTIREFDFEPKDHVELMENLNLIDFDGGSKVAGQKFYYLKS